MTTGIAWGFRAILQAQLILTLLLACVAPMFMLEYPRQTHAVKIDLPVWPELLPPPAVAEPEMRLLSSLYFPKPPPDWGEMDEAVALELTADGRILFAGRDVDFAELRTGLDILAMADRWLDFRPHAEARYELFLEVLATVRRASIEKMHLPNSPFANALIDRRG